MAESLLTEKHLKNARPSAKEYYLSDGGGLYARVMKAGSRNNRSIVFQYRFKISGKTGYFHCGTYPYESLAEARKRRDAARKLVRQGVHPGAHEKALEREKKAAEDAQKLEKTMNQLLEDWERVYLKTHRKDEGRLVRQFLDADVMPSIGHLKAKAVTRRHVVTVIDAIVARGTRRKANAVLSMLKQMFRHGLARGVIDVDPSTGLTKSHAGGKERARERNLSFEEIAELSQQMAQAGLPTHLQAAIWLLLATGARVTELMHARWEEIDGDTHTWLIPAERSKNQKPHVVHLSRFAQQWLALLQTQSGATPFIFPGRTAGHPINEKWLGKAIRDRQRCTALAKRTSNTMTLLLTEGPWRAHDLRRTMASRMGDLQIPPHVIEKCLNHSLGGILAVYQHQEYMDDRRVAFSRWGDRLELLAPIGTSNELGPRYAVSPS